MEEHYDLDRSNVGHQLDPQRLPFPGHDAAQVRAAGPLGVVLRGLILNAPIIPILAVVLSATSALGIIIWRTLYLLLNRKAS